MTDNRLHRGEAEWGTAMCQQTLAEEGFEKHRKKTVGIDLGREPVPDETTICKFRNLLEAHNLGKQLFVLIQDYLQENGLKVSRGAIVDATIISAPRSTKNQDGWPAAGFTYTECRC